MIQYVRMFIKISVGSLISIFLLYEEVVVKFFLMCESAIGKFQENKIKIQIWRVLVQQR